PNTRRCAATGKELPPGVRFYSVLLDQGGRFVRQDYSSEAWQGPPPGAFSFWAGRVPAPDQARRPPINDELLLECFGRLQNETEPGRVNFRYVVALLLMRRKRLKFDRVETDGGREILHLRCTRTGTAHEVVNPRLSEEEMAAVQDEVFKVLGWE
ncbi:MAG TPA: hypothetical protein VJ739_01795, partial [Gemmataceae bacterium]|nr:hypothetical protein [Gemmataceae bacterium]